MNRMYNGRDGLHVWAYMGNGTQWEVSLLKLPRSVGSWFLDLNGELKKFMDGMPVERRSIDRYGLRWVCTYGTSHPRSMECALSIVIFTERLGTRTVTAKYPGRVERN